MNGTLLAVAGGMALVCLVGAALPLARRWSQAGLHLFVAVAVGIFLGTLFLHLMPELSGGHPTHTGTHAESAGGHESHAEAHAESAETAGPESPGEESGRAPWVAALAGLLTLFLIEKIWLSGKSHVHVQADGLEHGQQRDHRGDSAHDPAHGHDPEDKQHHDHDHNHDHEHAHEHAHTHEPVHAFAASAPVATAGADGHVPGEVCDHDAHSYDAGHTSERHRLVWYASFLGLTIHALLEGLSMSVVIIGVVFPWPFVLSMLMHKACDGFTLATVIRLANVPTRQAVTFLLLFALVTPVGMLVGGVLADQMGATHVGILRGFACGSFLYVAVYDLLPEVFHDAQQRYWRLSAVGLGILIVAASEVWMHG